MSLRAPRVQIQAVCDGRRCKLITDQDPKIRHRAAIFIKLVASFACEDSEDSQHSEPAADAVDTQLRVLLAVCPEEVPEEVCPPARSPARARARAHCVLWLLF
eukprot:SAG11_NODE_20816_length_437_cov_1.378698_1_plen_103_part_00